MSKEDLEALKRERTQLERDFDRVCHVGLSKFAEWVCKDAIGDRINKIDGVLRNGKANNSAT